LTDVIQNNSENPKKNRKRDKIIIILFLVIAIVSVELFRNDFFKSFRLINDKSIGTVTAKKNTVQRRLGDRVMWDRMREESQIYLWDLIQVGNRSDASLEVGDFKINLSENTLIRIVPSPDGEGIMIIVSQGSIEIEGNGNSGGLIVYQNGQYFRNEPFVPQETRLISPAANSRIRFNENRPVVHFTWTEIENASLYTLEVSSDRNFSNRIINENISTAFYTASDLEDGSYYWRVRPDYKMFPAHSGLSDFTEPSFFRIEKTTENLNAEGLSFAQWLAAESPQTIAVPAALPVVSQPTAAAVAPRPAPTPARSAQPSFLPAPRILSPVNNATFGLEELRAQRTINFSWSPVSGANAYNFALYRQAPSGRQQIVRMTLNRTNYTFENLPVLDRGTFVWQVEAVRQGNRGVEQRGRIAESTFIIDFPSPGPVHIEDTGILYAQ